jgi:hypothetical protein
MMTKIFSNNDAELKHGEIRVDRFKDVPLEFSGHEIIRVWQFDSLCHDSFHIAIYRTNAGKFISEAFKAITVNGARGWDAVVSKAAVHATFAEAVAWFAPGALTRALTDHLKEEAERKAREPVHID